MIDFKKFFDCERLSEYDKSPRIHKEDWQIWQYINYMKLNLLERKHKKETGKLFKTYITKN